MADYWPDGISLEDTQSPSEILQEADEQWRSRSDEALGLKVRGGVSNGGHPMLIVHAEHVPSAKTAELFSVLHRESAPYPARIQLRENDLPNLLKKSYYQPPSASALDLNLFMKGMSEGKTVENQWVADDPAEFRQLLRGALNESSVKSIILGLVTSVRGTAMTEAPEAESEPEGDDGNDDDN